ARFRGSRPRRKDGNRGRWRRGRAHGRDSLFVFILLFRRLGGGGEFLGRARHEIGVAGGRVLPLFQNQLLGAVNGDADEALGLVLPIIFIQEGRVGRLEVGQDLKAFGGPVFSQGGGLGVGSHQ